MEELSLTVWEWWATGGAVKLLEEKAHLLTDKLNHEAVLEQPLASPGSANY